MLFLYVMAGSQDLQAQDLTVTGKVTSAEDNTGLPGVNVVVKGTTTGTSTDADGVYRITVPANATLVFSFVGLIAQEVAVGNRSQINVSMVSDTRQLSEVVINAIGLETDRDKLGTAPTTVKGTALIQSGETSVLTGLSAKAPGVNITRSSGDPGAGAYILLRGQSTVFGSTQPLIVVDGIPISNSTYSSSPGDIGGGVTGVTGATEQSRLNDINPEDIASVEVLKSASAAALWGTRAANGVIMITTKKGQNSEGKINISFKSSLSVDKLNRTVPLQTAFGQGSGGQFVNSERASWGDKIANRSGGADTYVTGPGQFYAPDDDGNFTTNPDYDLYNGFVTFDDGTVRYIIPNGGSIAPNGTQLGPNGGKNSRETWDHSRDVFRTGYFVDNSLNLSGGTAKSNYIFSIANLNQKGIIKNNSDYSRTTAHMSAVNNLTNWLTVKLNANYVRSDNKRIQKGSNLSGLFLGGLRTPADFNSQYYEGDYTDASGAVILNRQVANRNPIGANPNSIYDNPFWSIHNVKSNSAVNRVFGNVELTLKPFEGFEVISRQGIDYSTDRRRDYYNALSSEEFGGLYREQTIQEYQFNSDIIGRVSHNFSTNFTGSVLAGFNLNHRQFEQVGGTATGFILPNAPPNLGNAPADQLSPFNNQSTIRTGALYAEISAGFYDQLFLTLTGRGETSSTFGPEAERTFYYPSGTIAWQFSKLGVFQDNTILSFGKIRASAGVVGRQPDPYTNNTTYIPAGFSESWGSGLSAANYGGGYGINQLNGVALAGNQAIKPERKSEIEFGADLRFLQDRFGISATYYMNETKDAIFPASITPSSGFSFQYKNAARLENKGVELQLDAQWLRLGDFSWTTSANWFRNRNKVLEMEGTTAFSLGGFSDPASYAVVGQPIGVLYGTAYAKNENGSLALDDNGFPYVADQNAVIGNPNPDWRAGIGNTFKFKQLSLYVLFDHLQGGDLYNGTRGALYTMGTHKDMGIETVAPKDLIDYDGTVIPTGTTFRGTIGNFGGGDVALTEAFYTLNGTGGGLAGAPAEAFIEKQTNTRLREVTLSYSLATPGFRKASKLQSVDFSITGRNLVLWTDYSGIDPETNLLGSINARGIDYFNNPNTRSFVFTIRVNY